MADLDVEYQHLPITDIQVVDYMEGVPIKTGYQPVYKTLTGTPKPVFAHLDSGFFLLFFGKLNCSILDLIIFVV